LNSKNITLLMHGVSGQGKSGNFKKSRNDGENGSEKRQGILKVPDCKKTESR